MRKRSGEHLLTEENLRHAIELNAEGVSVQTLARAFNLTHNDFPAVREKLQKLNEEGVIKKSREDFYEAVRPLSDLLIARVSESLNKGQQRIKLTIEGVDDNFPFQITMNRKLFRKRFGYVKIYNGEKIAVAVARQHGTELIATQIIDKVKPGKTPKITGRINSKKGNNIFLPNSPGIKTFFNAIGKVPEHFNPRTTFIADIPEEYSPYNPSVRISEQKWDPHTGTPISAIIAKKHGIKIRHSRQEEHAARLAISKSVPFQGRRNLTQEKILVIDPQDAKDHDDGILIERTRDGYRTLVVVSDVPFYVRPGSVLDECSRERGFTHYMKDDTTYHMLPARLVHAASLKEGRLKPVIYVEQFWCEQFEPVGSPEIGAGIIASQKQMTYGQFQDLADVGCPNISAYLELGKALVENMRTEKGLIFDHEEIDVRESFSRCLVSAMMIEANAAIAEFLDYNNIPFLSRTHTGKDNIHSFLETKEQLESWGYEVPDNIGDMNVDTLNAIIREAGNRKEGAMVESFIKSHFLHQAQYSTIPYGHFGLNRENYTHATSPIRRRADILTLRGVHTAFQNSELGLSEHDIDSLKQSAHELNVLQNLSRQIALDSQRYFATRDLQRLEGSTVRAMLGKVDPFRAEIILPEKYGLRKTVPIHALPHGWTLAKNNKALIFNNIKVPVGASLRLKIANVRPETASWDFCALEPVAPKVKPAPARPAYARQPA